MGGKTVALKTIGLLSAMALSGLPIPASDESRIPLFDGIFADIGDEQSIEQTVSTFSWHIGNIVRIIARAAPGAWCSSMNWAPAPTPPKARPWPVPSCCTCSHARTMTVATSHYDDLKAFAHKTPGFRNASLDLDPATHLPTYHLTVGVPGRQQCPGGGRTPGTARRHHRRRQGDDGQPTPVNWKTCWRTWAARRPGWPAWQQAAEAEQARLAAREHRA